MEINDKPSYVREGHKWVLKIYPGGRNQWEQAPEKWDVQGAVSGRIAITATVTAAGITATRAPGM